MLTLGTAVVVIEKKDERTGQVGTVVDIERGRMADSVLVAFDDGEEEVFLPSQLKKVEPKR